MNHLYFGDNIEVLREKIANESVDLVYLDPPFNSNASYNVLFRSAGEKAASAQAEAFRDTWTWDEEAEWAFGEVARIGGPLATFVNALHSALGRTDLMAYLVMMAVRLNELRRVLKPSGSLYLHCDPTASHYLKVMLDGVFGAQNFRGEIVWKRTNARATKGRWPRLHDVILFYTNGPQFFFDALKTKAESGKIPHTLITGPGGQKFQTYELTAPGTTKDGESGRPWRGYDPGKFGRHWANSPSTMDAWDADGLIHWPAKGGFPRRRDNQPFDPDSRQVVVGDVWTDIDRINQSAAERIGYPTQKPISLMERIIRASSREGDVVLDPFCGCGTTVHAAEKLHRRWVGIDVAYHAVQVISDRLKKHFGLEPGRDYELGGRPNDFASASRLAERDKYQFQWWANYLVGVQQLREVKRGRDQGIDGEFFFPAGPGRGFGRILTSVKGGKHVGVSDLRDFRGVLERESADAGLFICLGRPTRDMRTNAASAGFCSVGAANFPRLQIVSIEEWFDDGVRPVLPTMAHIARRDAALEPAARKASRKADPRQGELLLPIKGTTDLSAKVHVNPIAAHQAGEGAERSA